MTDQDRIRKLEARCDNLAYCLNRVIDHVERLDRRAGLENYPTFGPITLRPTDQDDL